MKTCLSVLLLAVAILVGTATAQSPSSAPSGPPSQGVRSTWPGISDSAIYFRDVSGRCLRLQLIIGTAESAREPNGHLNVFLMPNEACAKRERAAAEQRK